MDSKRIFVPPGEQIQVTKLKKSELFNQLMTELYQLNGVMFLNENAKISKEAGITPARWRMLGVLVKSKDPMTVPEIAKLIHQKKQSVQRVIHDMNSEGLVEFKENPAHALSRKVILTKAGKKKYDSLIPVQNAWADTLSKKISASELKNTLTVVQKLSDELKEEA